MKRILLSLVFLIVPLLLNADFDPYQVTPDHTASMQELIWHATLKKAVASDSAVDVYKALQTCPTRDFKKAAQPHLLHAAINRRRNTLSALLVAGVSPNMMYSGQKLIHYVIQQGDLETAKILVNAKADFSGNVAGNQDAFTYTSTHFNKPVPNKDTQIYLDLMYAMIKQGYDLKANFSNKDISNNAWYWAIRNADEVTVRFFRGRNSSYSLPVVADPNQVFVCQDGSTWTPVFMAIQHLHLPSHDNRGLRISSFNSLLGLIGTCGEINLNQRAKPNGKEQTPISYLLETYPKLEVGIGRIVETLMRYGQTAAADGIELFIKNGGDPNALFSDDGDNPGCQPRIGRQVRRRVYFTLLGLAIMYNDIKAVKILISAKADLNQLTDNYLYHVNGITPYGPLALASGSIADLLVEHGSFR